MNRIDNITKTVTREIDSSNILNKLTHKVNLDRTTNVEVSIISFHNKFPYQFELSINPKCNWGQAPSDV
jgi:hypothetical protein